MAYDPTNLDYAVQRRERGTDNDWLIDFGPNDNLNSVMSALENAEQREAKLAAEKATMRRPGFGGWEYRMVERYVTEWTPSELPAADH